MLKKIIGVAILASLVWLTLSGCVASNVPVEMQTRTVTVSPTPPLEPTKIPDGANDTNDAQHVVSTFCRLGDAYATFQSAMTDLQGNPQNFSVTRELAGEVAWAIGGVMGLLVIGPSGGWSDPWFALAAIGVADSVLASKTYFDSAEIVASADDLFSLYFSVLDNPLDTSDIESLVNILPPDEAAELIDCLRS